MKKLSSKGFTLIELLAVITIMGILMMVAIPAVSRTIENSRRDTFANVAGEYLRAVRNGVLADEIECYYKSGAAGSTGKWRVASSLPDGTYYFPICTGETDECVAIGEDFQKSTSGTPVLAVDAIIGSSADLLESGGKSPFGSADLFGYVTWTKTTKGVGEATTDASGKTTYADSKSTTVYKVWLQDSGKHGLTGEQETAGLKRSNVSTSVTDAITNVKTASGAGADDTIRGVCKVS